MIAFSGASCGTLRAGLVQLASRDHDHHRRLSQRRSEEIKFSKECGIDVPSWSRPIAANRKAQTYYDSSINKMIMITTPNSSWNWRRHDGSIECRRWEGRRRRWPLQKTQAANKTVLSSPSDSVLNHRFDTEPSRRFHESQRTCTIENKKITAGGRGGGRGRGEGGRRRRPSPASNMQSLNGTFRVCATAGLKRQKQQRVWPLWRTGCMGENQMNIGRAFRVVADRSDGDVISSDELRGRAVEGTLSRRRWPSLQSSLFSFKIDSRLRDRPNTLHFQDGIVTRFQFCGVASAGSSSLSDSNDSESYFSPTLGGYGGGSSNPRMNGESDTTRGLRKGSVIFIERQRKNTFFRIVRYWIFFGALTLASALALEHYLQPRLQFAAGAIGGSFALVVFFIAAIHYVRMVVLSGLGGRGSGGSIAESLGGEAVTAQSHAKLMAIIENVSWLAGIPTPNVFVLPCRELNAFAAGLSPVKDASISVTKGLLETLTATELAAVIGHETGHIINGDMKSGTHLASLLMGFYGVFILGMHMWDSARRHSLQRFNLSMDSSLESDTPLQQQMLAQRIEDAAEADDVSGPIDRDAMDLRFIAIPVIAIGFVAYAVGTVMQRAVSRKQELAADGIGVALTDAEALKKALRKITASDSPRDLQGMYRGQHIAHMLLHRGGAKPASSKSSFLPKMISRIFGVFSTHPPIEERLEVIDKASAEITKLEGLK